MDIDNMTIGDVKRLAAMFGGAQESPASPLIGRHVIVRSRDSGVHAGTLQSVSGRHVVLRDARRLWYWVAAKEHTLSAVALYGLKSGSKIASELPVTEILDACEIIPTTPTGEASIKEMKSHDQK